MPTRATRPVGRLDHVAGVLVDELLLQPLAGLPLDTAEGDAFAGRHRALGGHGTGHEGGLEIAFPAGTRRGHDATQHEPVILISRGWESIAAEETFCSFTVATDVGSVAFSVGHRRRRQCMGLRYVAEGRSRLMMLEVVRPVAPSCIGLHLGRRPGPFRPQSWRIAKLDVLTQDYAAARDEADELEGKRQWICVPDGHPLDGQVFGREERREMYEGS